MSMKKIFIVDELMGNFSPVLGAYHDTGTD